MPGRATLFSAEQRRAAQSSAEQSRTLRPIALHVMAFCTNYATALLCGQLRKEQRRVNYTLFPLGGGYRLHVTAPVKTVYGQHTHQVKESLHSFA